MTTTTTRDLQAWKTEGRRWAMLTAYDFPTAQILDRAGIPVLLVGDSVGRNVLGYADELPVTMEDMLHHVRAVTRGVEPTRWSSATCRSCRSRRRWTTACGTPAA